jgi:hypothetical protein
MKNYNKAVIKLAFEYQSQYNNTWPFILIKINHEIVSRFQADSTNWECVLEFDPKDTNRLQIEHYGKNYITDQRPDKYFELKRCYINDVDLKHHIHSFKQTAYLAPWDTDPPPSSSLYLGHNGYLELEFAAPVNNWIKKMFNVSNDTMHGQHTTRKTLIEVKQYFGF